MSTNLPPVPIQAPMTDDKSITTSAWSDFFNKLFTRVGGHLGSTDDFSATKSSSGSQILPSGILIQWGTTGSLSSATTNTITFPTAFSTACLQVMVGLKDITSASTADTGHFGTGAYSKTDFALYNRTASAYVFNWIAIGY